MSQGSVVIHRVVVLKRVHRHEGGVQEREWQRHFFNTLVCVVKCWWVHEHNKRKRLSRGARWCVIEGPRLRKHKHSETWQNRTRCSSVSTLKVPVMLPSREKVTWKEFPEKVTSPFDVIEPFITQQRLETKGYVEGRGRVWQIYVIFQVEDWDFCFLFSRSFCNCSYLVHPHFGRRIRRFFPPFSILLLSPQMISLSIVFNKMYLLQHINISWNLCIVWYG